VTLVGLMEATSNCGRSRVWRLRLGCQPQLVHRISCDDCGGVDKDRLPEGQRVPRHHSESLIGRRRLGVVDDEDIHWPLRRFQFEPELLLRRCEDRRSVWIEGEAVDLRQRAKRTVRRGFELAQLIGRPFEIQVEPSGQPGPIHHDTTHGWRQELQNLRAGTALGPIVRPLFHRSCLRARQV
jgi:hypothetical protein